MYCIVYNIQEIERRFEERLKIIEATHEAKLDALYKVLEKKDEIIGRLNMEIGEMKQSISFLTNETTEIKKSVTNNTKTLDTKLRNTDNNVKDIKLKTIDLEDRSRRCNLVFYNFPEPAQGRSEDCERLVVSLLASLKILDDEQIWIERAHRLGRKRAESDKPRPVIVCFSYFKQKQEVVRNAAKFKTVSINFSEDYSRETLQEHKKLFAFGTHAKQTYEDENKSIKYFKVSYKRLVVTYNTNKKIQNSTTFVKSFTLRDIHNNDNWFVPIEQNRSNATHQSYSTSRANMAS